MRHLGGLLRELSWPEWRHHPWRQLAALIAVMLGVALGFSVQLINQSALSEFSAAVRAVNGAPDFELRAQRDGFDETLYGRVARHPGVAIASPVIEVETVAIDAQGRRWPLKIVGLDPLVAAPLAPALIPRPRAGSDAASLLEPHTLFVNPQAQRILAGPSARVQTPTGIATLTLGGGISAGGAALAVMDIAGVQATFGWIGRLTRIDVRLRAGADRVQVLRELTLPSGIRAAAPDEGTQRVSDVSRAYRVNLTVLALVALFTGAFLVFSILSLSVAKRQSQLALLGVLGLSARLRLALVLTESALLGIAGSVLGLALGTGLAALALRLLAGDLGGGYFPGVAPALQFSWGAAAAYGLLGTLAAVIGGWLPARAAQRLAPAQALKGLGGAQAPSIAKWIAPALLIAAVALAFAPAVGGIALAAYASVACILLGGIASVPLAVAALLRLVRPPAQPLWLLAVERARHERQTATVAVAGVVASLSLAIALTVMVASFRASVTQWLDTVLPADLYVRAGASQAAGDIATLPPDLPQRAAQVAGVTRVAAQRVAQLQWAPSRPPVVLIARALDAPQQDLPLVSALGTTPPGAVAIYVSEAMVTLYGASANSTLELPLPSGLRVRAFVRGVWRDYARQHGTVVMAAADYQRLSGDVRINDLALWLRPGADLSEVERRLRGLAGELGLDPGVLEFASAGEIRLLSLRIFDRSFAVTYWLQGVAIAIGLFGIGASFSAQVLARRKEFGLLAHLGLTRRDVLVVVAAEGATWTSAGALLGLVLGLAVSVVLVKVVNPQSFHWTMDLLLPWGRLGVLCAGVVLAGTATAWLAARRAAAANMALSVKEDW